MDTQTPAVQDGSPFTERDAAFDDVTLHFRIGGAGTPVVLLHGFAETSRMWDPVLPVLSGRHTVIVPDLRGAGDSSKPEGGYDRRPWRATSTGCSGRWAWKRRPSSATTSA